MRRRLLALTLAAAASGCWWDGPELPEDFAQCPLDEPAEPTGELPVEAPTYHRDVRPILEDNCTACHSDGGIAPFSLADYESAAAFGALALAAVDAGTMPPSPASECCAPLRTSHELPASERDLIARWLDDGTPAGDPSHAPPTTPPPGLSRVDVEVELDEPYTPTATIGDSDDQRCFLVDWPLDADTFVTGLELIPGRRELVHHAIIYAIPAGQAAIYEALDSDGDGPGWSCPGGVFQSADAYVGSWTPGAGVVDMPAGLGREVKGGSRILLNVHYELSAGAAPDQTRVQFRVEDEVETPVEVFAVMDPSWLLGETMMIPAGEADVEFGYAYDPATWLNFGQELEVHAVSLHMHELGRRGSLAVLRADGSVDCLLHIDDWDFDWQDTYFLAEPVRLGFGDRLYVECHFDNSAANQPDGEAPRDQWWGDDKEMCIGSVVVSR